jgi:prophage regulatory protein
MTKTEQRSDEHSPHIQNFLRCPKVCEVTGLSITTLYELMKAGEFPRPIRIAKRLVAWPEAVVAEWQASRITEGQK